MTLDRTKTTPFLIRTFFKVGDYPQIDSLDKLPVSEELQIYAWPDSTLREIADVVRDILDEAKAKNSKQSFRLIYPDLNGKHQYIELGVLSNTTKGFADNLALSAVKFHPGDYLSIAIYTQ